MRRKWFWALFLLNGMMLAAQPVSAALTWDECQQEARTKNPELRTQNEQVKQAQAGKGVALSYLLPQVSSSLGWNWSRSFSLAETRNWSAGLSVQQLLFDGLSSLNSYQQADLTLIAARCALEETISQVRQGLRQAYIELLRSQSLVGLSRTIEERRQKNLDLVKMRYEAGREHRGSLLLAQAQLAQARADRAQSERDLTLAQYGLVQRLGRADFTPLQVEGELDALPAAPAEPDLPTLVRDHPAYRALAAQAENARLASASATANLLPTVSASASLGRSGPDWFPSEQGLSAGISLNWPLFTGLRRWSVMDRTRSAYAQAQAALESRAQSLRYDLVNAWTAYAQAREAVDVRRQFLAAAEERSRISEAEYTTGLIGFDNWTLIEDDLVSAKRAYLSAQAQAQNAEAGWVRAQGKGFDHE